MSRFIHPSIVGTGASLLPLYDTICLAEPYSPTRDSITLFAVMDVAFCQLHVPLL